MIHFPAAASSHVMQGITTSAFSSHATTCASGFCDDIVKTRLLPLSAVRTFSDTTPRTLQA